MDDAWQIQNLFSSELGAWREERKKRELQRKFEERCASEGLLPLLSAAYEVSSV